MECIIDTIKILKAHKMSDTDITNYIKKEFPEFRLWFTVCRNIDVKIYGEGGSKWRYAYKYPKKGDIIDGRIVNYSGFFTFSLE